MSWLDLQRVPESEGMNDCGEIEAYSSAAAQAFLSAIDDTFLQHALRLLANRGSGQGRGRLLDVGTGPGQMVFKLGRRLHNWSCTGVDRAPNMIREACAGKERLAVASDRQTVTKKPLGDVSGEVEDLFSRLEFVVADANCLPFPDASFDLVTCNSVLHHMARPERLLAELDRIAAPNAAILLRDLRRPSSIGYPLHVRWHGRHYSGLMYKLYCDSVRSAYTPKELSALLTASPVSNARLFTSGATHLGFERWAS